MTLVELLITIVVLSILLALGVPGLQNFIKSTRVSAQANDLVVAIQLARSEAVKRGSGTVVCASNNEATCSGSDDWSTGWIVFSDIGQDGDLNLDANADLVEDCVNDDCIIMTKNNITKSSLNGTALIGKGPGNIVKFLPNGMLDKSPDDDDIEFSLIADGCIKSQSRLITITTRGHTSVQKVECP